MWSGSVLAQLPHGVFARPPSAMYSGTEPCGEACHCVDMDVKGSLLPAHLGGVVVLASVVAVDPGGWYPFVVAKFSAVALAVVVCWWASSRDRSGVLDHRAFRAFALLLVVMSVAAVFGRDRLYAWTGTPERHLGVVTWVLFFAAFVAGSRLADQVRLVRFVRWVVVSGIALGVYTMIERWHQLIETNSDSVRLGGLYGSASFLGAALCLILPVSIAVSVGDDSAWWRRAAALSTALCIAALIGSGTRAAWLGLLVCTVVVVAGRVTAHREGEPGDFTVVDRGRPWWQGRPRAALMVGSVTVGALMSRGTDTSVTARSSGGSSRFDEWGVGIRVVANHLWIGTGPEGYRTALADGVTASYERTYGRAVLPDRAHNVFIDVAAAGGVVAAILYLVLAVLVTTAAWRAFWHGSPLLVGLAAAAVAYLVQQFFLFPVATIDPIFWLIAGILVSVPAPTVTRAPRRSVSLVAITALVVVFATGVLAVAADRAARDAVASGSTASAQRATTLRPDVARYWLLAAELAPRTIGGYDSAVASAQRALQLTPHDPIVERRVADALTRRAIATGTATDSDAALEAWQQLADNDANCYQCHLGLGYSAALSSDVPGAIDAFEAAVWLERSGTTEAADALAGLIGFTDSSGTDFDG